MRKAKWIASASPNDSRVFIKRRIFVYGRVRKKILTPMQCCLKLMTQIAKYTLRETRRRFSEHKNE